MTNPFSNHARRDSFPTGKAAPQKFEAASPTFPPSTSISDQTAPVPNVARSTDGAAATPVKNERRLSLAERLKKQFGDSTAAGEPVQDTGVENPQLDEQEQILDVNISQFSIAAKPAAIDTKPVQQTLPEIKELPNPFAGQIGKLTPPPSTLASKDVDRDRYHNRLSEKTKIGQGLSGAGETEAGWDLRHDLSSAKALLNLVSAVAVVPGNSPRIPVEKRVEVLTSLIASSRDQAFALAQKANGGEIPSDALVGKFMSSITYANGRHWSRTGETLPDEYTEIGLAVLDTNAEWVTDEILRFLSAGEAYQKIDTADLAKDALSVTAAKAGWLLYDAVKDAGFGSANTSNYNERFSYNLPVATIVNELLGAATQIANEFATNFPDFDLKVRARKHGIERAAKLLASEYTGITREKLNEAEVDPLTRPAMTATLASSWPRVLAACHRRARTSYIEIENHAREWMSIAFLATPKQDTSKSTDSEPANNLQVDASPNSERG